MKGLTNSKYIDTIVFTFNTVVQKGALLVLFLIAANMESLGDYGRFSLIRGNSNLTASFIIYVISMSTYKFHTKDKKHNLTNSLESIRFIENISLIIFSFLILISWCCYPSWYFPNTPGISPLIYTLLFFYLVVKNQGKLSILIAEIDIKIIFKYSLISLVLNAVIIIIYLCGFTSIYIALACNLLGTYVVLSTILYNRLSPQSILGFGSYDKEKILDMLAMAKYLLSAAVISNFLMFFLRNRLYDKVGAESLAGFDVLYQLFNFVGIIGGSVTSSVVSRFANLDGALPYFYGVSRLLFLISSAFIIICFCLGERVLSFFGSGYVDFSQDLFWLSLASLFSAQFYLNDKRLIGSGEIFKSFLGYGIYTLTAFTTFLVFETSVVSVAYSLLAGFGLAYVYQKMVFSCARSR